MGASGVGLSNVIVDAGRGGNTENQRFLQSSQQRHIGASSRSTRSFLE